jgi:hypothetical protein
MSDAPGLQVTEWNEEKNNCCCWIITYIPSYVAKFQLTFQKYRPSVREPCITSDETSGVVTSDETCGNVATSPHFRPQLSATNI